MLPFCVTFKTCFLYLSSAGSARSIRTGLGGPGRGMKGDIWGKMLEGSAAIPKGDCSVPTSKYPGPGLIMFSAFSFRGGGLFASFRGLMISGESTCSDWCGE